MTGQEPRICLALRMTMQVPCLKATPLLHTRWAAVKMNGVGQQKWSLLQCADTCKHILTFAVAMLSGDDARFTVPAISVKLKAARLKVMLRAKPVHIHSVGKVCSTVRRNIRVIPTRDPVMT